MGYNENLNKITRSLYDLDYYDDSVFTDETADKYEEIAENSIEQYGWDNVFQSWFEYLVKYCKTPKEVCNFAHLFWSYNGQDHVIENTYEFLGYFYYIMDLNPAKYEEKYSAVTIMDSIANELQENAGLKKDIWCDDNYAPEKDPEIIKAVEKWRSKNDA